MATFAAPRAANRSAIALPTWREPPVIEDRGALEAGHRFGSGSYAGAEPGSSSQPIRERDLPPCSALDDACPSASSSGLLLAVAADGMVAGQVGDQLAHPRTELKGEVRRRRPDESVDVADRGLGHGCKRNGKEPERSDSSGVLRGRGLCPCPCAARTVRMRRLLGIDDAADDGRALGAQPHRHALHPHARVRAARLCDCPLRRRGADLSRDRPRLRADAPDPPARLRPCRARGTLPLAESALVRLRARADERLYDCSDSRRDADLRSADRARLWARAALRAVLARRRRLVCGRRPRRARCFGRRLRRHAGNALESRPPRRGRPTPSRSPR